MAYIFKMCGDRTSLFLALDRATKAYHEDNPNGPPLLGPEPGDAVLAPLTSAIAACAAYEAVAGQVVFAGGAGPVLDPASLAYRLFSKGGWPGEDAAGAVDWLLKILGTREATILVKAAIWGMKVDQTVTLDDGARILPFGELPDSYMKGRLQERARPCYDGSAWITATYYDVPDAAFVSEVPRFPYIRSDGTAFQRMLELEEQLNDLSILMQATATGYPIAVACWFEYQDHDLEYSAWENAFSWSLPEVHPRVGQGMTVDGDRLRDNVSNFSLLPDNRRKNLLRSMERFRLSQSRRQLVDRILDLALAFEIAVSDAGGENAPPSYKVSVRTAQVIGGDLVDRLKHRQIISNLYKIRSQAAHGGQPKLKGKESPDDILDSCCLVYTKLIERLLTISTIPGWQTIEIECLT